MRHHHNLPSPSPEETNKRYGYGDLQKEMTPVINAVLLFYALLALTATVIQYTATPQNLPFVGINLISGTLYLLLFLFWRRAGLMVKMAIITIPTLWVIGTSFYFSGLTGTGVITLLGLQILYLVICRPKPAVAASLISVAFALTAALLVHFKVIQYDASLVDRMNSLVHWIPPIMALTVTSLLVGASLMTLKKKLMSHIARAEETNALLTARDRELELLAFTDPLTGLPNKALFYRRVKEKMASGRYSHGHIILVDIPNFRLINSLIGADGGDRIIAAIGKLLKGYSSETNIIARLNGVEFIGWAEGWAEDSFDQTFAKFKYEVKSQMERLFPQITLDFNFAIVTFPRDGATLEECYKNASLALQVAKQDRVDAPVRFTPEMLSHLSEEMTLRNALEAALEKKEFIIHYQQKVEAATGRVVGLEALARWKTPEGKMVPPDLFIPVLTKYNLIIPFGELIFNSITDDLPRIDRLFGDTTGVSINISPLHFMTPGFTAFVLQGLTERGIDPRRITLEITEDVFIQDLAAIRTTIRDLRMAGLGISLDDFGKGFSSLAYLRNLELSELKIDRSFISDIDKDPRQYGIVLSICTLGHNLGFTVVAEGVETEEQYEKLRSSGCDILQGYYFSRPSSLTAEDS